MSLAVKDVLKMAQAQLERNNIADAKLSSELIFMYLMGIDKMGFFKLWGTMLDDYMCDRYLDIINERAGGKPLQYITGEQEFMGFCFKVNPDVLIPRQDTEILTAEVVSLVNEKGKKTSHVLDLGCGSGAIGLSIAKLCDNAKVTLSDISKAAVETAKKNASALSAGRKVSFVAGNWFEPFNKRFRRVKFDFIVSNPPYIKSRELSELQTEIKDHEPLLALDGGLDGLAYFRKIVPKAHLHLNKGGVVALEIGSGQANDVLAIAAECGVYKDVRVLKDFAGLDRVVVLRI